MVIESDSEMVRETVDKGNPVGAITGDEDSTILARLRRDVDEAIEKKSDNNHMKKIIANELYAIQKQHKQLSVKVIKYIQKSFNYMWQQNRGNSDRIKEGLNAIPFHPFADHQFCSDNWCGYLQDPEGYRYKSLPYCRPLTDLALQADLKKIFHKLVPQAEKLANLESTQANESLNNSIASKAPKARFYSGSESLNFRVGAAVSQKNLGHRPTYDVEHVSLGIRLAYLSQDK